MKKLTLGGKFEKTLKVLTTLRLIFRNDDSEIRIALLTCFSISKIFNLRGVEDAVDKNLTL